MTQELAEPEVTYSTTHDIIYVYIYVYIQTNFTPNSSMWGSLRLAPFA